MSEMIETEFRGFRITYAENQDVWRCHALDMDGATLTQIKNKIGRYLAKVAKAAEIIPAFHVEYSGKIEPCSITSVANTLTYDKKPEVWTFTESSGLWRGEDRVERTRRKYPAGNLVLDTPENRALIAAAELVVAEAQEADKRAKAALEAIPRVDVATLRKDDEGGE